MTGHPDPYINSLLIALGDQDPIAVLRDAPLALRRGTGGMSESQLSRFEAPGKWSARQMLAHLADSELVGGFRFRMILAHDRPPLAAYDQDLWARKLHYEAMDVDHALDTFAALRASNVRLMESASPAERKRIGIHAERGEESLEFLMKIYAGHDLVHQKQLARIRKAVGG
jgi:hypothetical protein